MNKHHSNKFNAYQGIAKFLHSSRKTFKDIPLMVALVDQFLAVFDEIKSLKDKSGENVSDFTSAKVMAKEKMADVVSSYASAGIYYAMDTFNHELKIELDITFSEIRYAKDGEAVRIAKGIESLLLSHKENMAEYLMTDEDFQILHQAIEGFDSLFMNREEYSDDSVMFTRHLEVLFQKADAILKERMDRVVKRLKVQLPDFYERYFVSRTIVDH